MPTRPFRCQGFTVHQDIAAMKVGTDAILLAAFLHHPNPRRILDIGTGTGILALQAAFRFSKAEILGVDIDEAAAQEASQNFKRSAFASRLNIIHDDIAMLAYPDFADLVVCNPPYFEEHISSLELPRNRARAAEHLPLDILLDRVRTWLHPERGRFQCILPARREGSLLHLAEARGLHLYRRISIRPRSGDAANRVLIDLSASMEIQKAPSRTLCIYEGSDHHPEYVQFTKSVYGKDLSKISLKRSG